MKLNTDRINAFFQVAKEKSFNRAANTLCLTQSALSQRVLKLEQELKTTLLIRGNSGISITKAGQLLFEHIQKIRADENNLLEQICGRSGEDSGILRVASFSSVLRSVVMPSLQEIIRDSLMHVEFFSREIRELPEMLESGEVDFVISDDSLKIPSLIAIPLGVETLVHILNCKYTTTTQLKYKPVFLDHDAEDMTTYNFFKAQGQPDKEIHRRFYDDIYGLIDGVKLGFGEAIVSKHMIPLDDNIEQVTHKNIVESKVVLYYRKNRELSELSNRAISLLKKNANKYLSS